MNKIINLGSIVGPPGPPGQHAVVQINARGEWNNSTAYMQNDFVMCTDGNAYIALHDNTMGRYPSDNPTHWTRFVARGADGPVGPAGVSFSFNNGVLNIIPN